MCTFVIVVCWVLLQVSVAVLLDNFVAATARLEQEERAEKIRERKQVNLFKSPLEPLVAKLARGFLDDSDLSAELRTVFEVLDSNRTGSLSNLEFCAAMKKLDFQPRIYLTESDYASITRHGGLCEPGATMSLLAFERVMREQMRLYALAMLSTNPALMTPDEEAFARLGSLKLLLNEQRRQGLILDRLDPAAAALPDPFLTATSSTSIHPHNGLRRHATVAGSSTPSFVLSPPPPAPGGEGLREEGLREELRAAIRAGFDELAAALAAGDASRAPRAPAAKDGRLEKEVEGLKRRLRLAEVSVEQLRAELHLASAVGPAAAASFTGQPWPDRGLLSPLHPAQDRRPAVAVGAGQEGPYIRFQSPFYPATSLAASPQSPPYPSFSAPAEPTAPRLLPPPLGPSSAPVPPLRTHLVAPAPLAAPTSQQAAPSGHGGGGVGEEGWGGWRGGRGERAGGAAMAARVAFSGSTLGLLPPHPPLPHASARPISTPATPLSPPPASEDKGGRSSWPCTPAVAGQSNFSVPRRAGDALASVAKRVSVEAPLRSPGAGAGERAGGAGGSQRRRSWSGNWAGEAFAEALDQAAADAAVAARAKKPSSPGQDKPASPPVNPPPPSSQEIAPTSPAAGKGDVRIRPPARRRPEGAGKMGGVGESRGGSSLEAAGGQRGPAAGAGLVAVGRSDLVRVARGPRGEGDSGGVGRHVA